MAAARILITGSTPGLGLAFQFEQLACWLKRSGAEVFVAGCDGEASPGLLAELEREGVQYHDLPVLRYTGLRQILRPSGEFAKFTDHIQPDVAIITTIGHLADVGRKCKLRPKCVWWLRSIRNTKWYAPLARRLGAVCANRWASQVWVQCAVEKRNMLAAGLRNETAYIVPNPIDVSWWSVKAELPLPGVFRRVLDAKRTGMPIIVYPASLFPAKRHDTLLRATAIARKRCGDIFLCCPGRGDAGALTKLARQLGLDGLVMFTERLVPQEAIPPLLKAADLAVFCSESETYGKALVEALGMGIPVVTTRVGMAIEAEAAGAAYVVDVGDHYQVAQAITDLLRSPEKRRRLGHRAQSWVGAELSYQVVGKRILDLIARL